MIWSAPGRPSVGAFPAFLTPSVDKKGALDGFAVHGADFYYSVPNHTIRTILNELAQSATPSGQLRSVAPGWTFWAVESLIDEVAHATGRDPAELRLSMLDGAGDNAGAQRLANALARGDGLAPAMAPRCCPRAKASASPASARRSGRPRPGRPASPMSRSPSDGTVKVKKLTVASDVGTAINPDGVRAQVMGAAFWGMSLAMLEKATMKDGAIEQTNFDSYTPMRMADAPEIEVAVIANGEMATGTGEPTVTVIAPAIGNAIFNAVGARVRGLPITAEAVKAAMKA